MSEDEKDKQIDALQRMLAAFEKRMGEVERELVTAYANLEICAQKLATLQEGASSEGDSA